jgi:hypothetical protein
VRITGQDVVRIRAFWDWFVKNTPTMAQLRAQDFSFADELKRRLERIRNGVTWELAGDETECTLFISADGFRELIPYVQAVVENAPKLDGWRVVAFRQRTGIGAKMQFRGATIDPSQTYFELVADGKKINLKTYVSKTADVESEASIHTVFLMLDHLLGEYDVMTKMGLFDLIHVPPYPEQCGLIPAKRLAEEFDKLWEQIVCEYQGG